MTLFRSDVNLHQADEDVMWCGSFIYFILSDSVTPAAEEQHFSDREDDDLNVDK